MDSSSSSRSFSREGRLFEGRIGDPLPLDEEVADDAEDEVGGPCALFLVLAPELSASSPGRRGRCRASVFSGKAPLFLPSDGLLREAPKNRGVDDVVGVDPSLPPPPPGRCCSPWLSPSRRSKAADIFVIEEFFIYLSLRGVAICLASAVFLSFYGL
jgi:hypothetical protein